MPLIACFNRSILRFRGSGHLRKRLWADPRLLAGSLSSRRCFYDGGQSLAVEEALKEGSVPDFWKDYKASFNVPKSTFQFDTQIPISQVGTKVTATGFLGKRRNLSRALTFVTLNGGGRPEHRIQLLARLETSEETQNAIRTIPQNSAVSVTGILDWKYEAKDAKERMELDPEMGKCFIDQLEIRIQSIECLNSFPRDLQPQEGKDAGLAKRHLQIRFDPELSESLRFRSRVASFARSSLQDFQEVETPILFKSTPEGAREFVVPTRQKGCAYGLPQSPQQYKQILMASGINRYFQFAKCFRDEDHRADRQPEFTQIDLEMAWADGEDVMMRVETFIKSLWNEFAGPGTTIETPLPQSLFPRLTYNEAMSKYGSDKPDLRINGHFHRIDGIVPSDLSRMLTSIEHPIIEVFKLRLNSHPSRAQKFISDFMDSPDAEEFRNNPAGAPGTFVYDPQKPLEGLQAFGFEGLDNLKELYEGPAQAGVDMGFEEGDLLLVQAREDLTHSGGSTIFGRLRLAIHKAALSQDLVEFDPTHHFLWVTDFPLFTKDDGSGPGQEGASGFSATHHPFTAPKTAVDVDMLLVNPLNAIADHYDLVLNGVELGGGSRRIHEAKMQQFVMKEILKIPERRMSDFSHLFEALRGGCPPHAGFAFGFDRLIAIMRGKDSVRDVIAFPKDKNGRDLMVRSPTQLSQEQMASYHLEIRDPKKNQQVVEERQARSRELGSVKTLTKLLATIAEQAENGSIASNAPESKKLAYEGEQEEEKPQPAQYRPGELLPYAVMLYNFIGGKFLHESLKGLELLMKSLGQDVKGSVPIRKKSRPPKDTSNSASAADRLAVYHSELRTDILNQLRSIEARHKKADVSLSKEELREELEECLVPVIQLLVSLKTVKPMLGTLRRELEGLIQGYEDIETVTSKEISELKGLMSRSDTNCKGSPAKQEDKDAP